MCVVPIDLITQRTVRSASSSTVATTHGLDSTQITCIDHDHHRLDCMSSSVILGSMTRITNEAFADAVGCDFTHASKIRNGSRLPSLPLLIKIRRVYGLDGNEVLDAYAAGPSTFAEYLNSKVFVPGEVVQSDSHSGTRESGG
jgi:transcriptional regulator with XRE-family HTH domain